MKRAYGDLLQHIYTLNSTQTVKMGLTKIRVLHDALGRPLDAFRTVHVAGTNGKGSVCLKVATALSYSGYKTGLFISPHLFSYRERAQIDGTLIEEAEVETLLNEILSVANTRDITPSFFEITTLMAVLHFARGGVDCAVLETGLGGRLDCTNICHPDVTCITSIGLDHVRVLGDSLSEIATEKAGIMKPGVPVVIGPHFEPEADVVLRNRAKALGAPLLQVETSESLIPEHYDEINGRISRGVLDFLRSDCFGRITADAVAEGVKARPPCRFQHCTWSTGKAPHAREVPVIIDAAHNPLGMRALSHAARRWAASSSSSSQQKRPRRLRFVVGLSEDKDATPALRELLLASPRPHAGEGASMPECVHLAQSHHKRASEVGDLRRSLQGLNNELAARNAESGGPVNGFTYVASPSNGDNGVRTILSDALAQAAAAGDEAVVVCGSLYMMHEVYETLTLGPIATDTVLKGVNT